MVKINGLRLSTSVLIPDLHWIWSSTFEWLRFLLQSAGSFCDETWTASL
jgi:hypothetical protein